MLLPASIFDLNQDVLSNSIREVEREHVGWSEESDVRDGKP